MGVVVVLWGDLRKYARDGETRFEVEVEVDTTVGALLSRIGVTKSTAWNAALDGKIGHTDDRMADGSVLTVFPPIAGGG